MRSVSFTFHHGFFGMLLSFLIIPLGTASCLAGTVAVTNEGVTYTIQFDNRGFGIDQNGYLTSPNNWNYSATVSGGKPGEYYFYNMAHYQGPHHYWTNGDDLPFNWRMYRVSNTEGLAVSFFASRSRFPKTGNGDQELRALGLVPDGGPTQTDAGGYTRTSWNAIYSFQDLVSVVTLRIPWSEVFAGNTVVTPRRLSIDSSEGGITIPVFYATGAPGQEVEVEALPLADYKFLNWSIDTLGGGALSRSFADRGVFTFGDSDASIKANFLRFTPERVSIASDALRARLAVFDSRSRTFVPLPSSFIPEGNVRVLIHGWAAGQIDWVNQEIGEGRFPLVWNNRTWCSDFYALAANFALKDPGCTILMFSWIDRNATDSLPTSAAISRVEAPIMGGVLTLALDQVGIDSDFASNPQNKIQLFGFSHGCQVAATAVSNFVRKGMLLDQLTMIDSPENWGSQLGSGNNRIDETLRSFQQAIAAPDETSSIRVDNFFGRIGGSFGMSSAVGNVNNARYDGSHDIWTYVLAVAESASIGIPWSPPWAQASSLPSPRQRLTSLTVVETDTGVTATEGEITFEGSGLRRAQTTMGIDAGDQVLLVEYEFSSEDECAIGATIDGEERFADQRLGTSGETRRAAIDISGLAPGMHEVVFYAIGSESEGRKARISKITTGYAYPPEIRTVSGNVTVVEGERTELAVGLTGSGPFVVQWYRNGVALVGASGLSYEILAAGAGDNGVYWMTASGSGGSVTSPEFTVFVASKPTAVPTIPPWGLLVLAFVLTAVGAKSVRRA